MPAATRRRTSASTQRRYATRVPQTPAERGPSHGQTLHPVPSTKSPAGVSLHRSDESGTPSRSASPLRATRTVVVVVDGATVVVVELVGATVVAVVDVVVLVVLVVVGAWVVVVVVVVAGVVVVVAPVVVVVVGARVVV